MPDRDRDIATERLVLRPIRMADVPALVEVVFSDPLVAKGLAHDISEPRLREGFARGWCGDLGLDGDNSIWRDGGLGLHVITDGTGTMARPDAFKGVVGFHMGLKENRWSGEFFYALGSAYHGKRVMSEACAAVMDAFRALPNAGEVYAVYWSLLNPVSGRILRRLGFVEDGHRRLLEEYDMERLQGIRRFEIWRLKNAGDRDIPIVALEAAKKIGHLVAEGVSTAEASLAEIGAVVSGRSADDRLIDDIAGALKLGLDNPPFAVARYAVG